MGATNRRKGTDNQMQRDSLYVDDYANDASQDSASELSTTEDASTKKDAATEDGEESMSPEHPPFPRTVTGVIRIMRASGRENVAAFMEEINDTKKQAEQLLQSLQKLHRKKTGCYPQLPRRADND